MKKKISGVMIIVAVAAATIWNFNQSKNAAELSDLALANVEALAQGESGEVEVVCGAKSGACWIQNGVICFVGSYTFTACSFIGYTYVSCSSPCN